MRCIFDDIKYLNTKKYIVYFYYLDAAIDPRIYKFIIKEEKCNDSWLKGWI